MQPILPHRWDLSEQEAIALQTKLAVLVVTEDRLPNSIRKVAGVDVAYDDFGTRAFAAVAIMDVLSGKLEEIVSAEAKIVFPYVPGLLSFREIPALVAAFNKIETKPDLVICDGQGTAHPRRFGLACHLGVTYDLPTIGSAKTHYFGEGEAPGLKRGSVAEQTSAREIVGAALRTRDNIRPIYVSPGHRISLRTACDWILSLSSKYRLPEPIRLADQWVNKLKREAR